ncbi:MAG TPA: TIGR01777 family oxidoreductase [Cytophagaceae bacterium]|jgi:hypothetical protein|nr:TIGR01777 family oxidoreductase [Cytophagaceae bacterium]
MYNKIILAGGTGFIGDFLQEYFRDKAKEIVVLTRSQARREGNITYHTWDGKTLGTWKDQLEGAEMLINLSGKSVNCRYTEENKQAIFDSRTQSTHVLGEAVKQLKHPPVVWFNAASATIYRHAEDRPNDEFNGEYHNDFSVQVCKRWEESFEAIKLSATRKIILRIAIVLGKKDGVVKRFKTLTQFGLGGKQGSGEQYFSWIHEQDLAGIMEFLYQHSELEGIFNCSSPNPVKNKTMMSIYRKILKPILAIHSPAWLLKLGAGMIGTETELLLKSRWVLPKRLQEAGYEFKYLKLEDALEDILL